MLIMADVKIDTSAKIFKTFQMLRVACLPALTKLFALESRFLVRKRVKLSIAGLVFEFLPLIHARLSKDYNYGKKDKRTVKGLQWYATRDSRDYKAASFHIERIPEIDKKFCLLGRLQSYL